MSEDDPVTDPDGDGHAEDDGDLFADIEGVEVEEDPFTDPEGSDVEEDPFTDPEGSDVEDDPFADIDLEDTTGTGDPSVDSLFTEMDVSELDEDEVWSQLTEGASTSEPGPAIGVGSAGPDATASEERVVEKRSYCEQCEYFSKPPDVSCTYPNSTIIELVDTERFRVRNCPIVERRENSDISAISGGSGDESEREGEDPTAAADSESDD